MSLIQYKQTVANLVRRELLARARSFIAGSYRPEWPTVVVLPGGMGSELSFTDSSFVPGVEPGEVHPLWLRVSTLHRITRGDMLRLKLDERGREAQGYMGIATGALRVIASPYPRVENGLYQRQINYVEFGYDWRKSSLHAADNLRQFLDFLDREARAANKRSPLPVGLLAHSQGGLVAKQFVEDCAANDDAQASCSRKYYQYIVAAGTPFFGTLDHVNRYYPGISSDRKLAVEFLLINSIRNRSYNDRHDPAAWTSAVSDWRSMVATFPGLYPLVPSPKLTDPSVRERLGLDRCPVRVGDGEGSDANFFGNPDKLPAWLRWVYRGHRDDHEREVEGLAAPLRGYGRERFFCARGVGSRPNPKPLVLRLDHDVPTTYDFTAGKVLWTLAKHFALTIADGDMHDGVVPAWSAVLEHGHQVHDIHGAKHRSIVAHRRVLDLVRALALGEASSLAGAADPSDADDDEHDERVDASTDDAELLDSIGARWTDA